MNIDLDKLQALLRTLAEGDATEFEFEDEGTRLRIARGKPVVAAAPVAAPAPAAAPEPAPAAAGGAAAGTAPAQDANVQVVTSPFVGTFYRSPSPDAPPSSRWAPWCGRGRRSASSKR